MSGLQNIVAGGPTVFAKGFTDVDFGVRPQTATCAAVLDRRQHAFLGISPFNSRFSDDYVLRLARWAARQFDKFDFLLPDEESTSLLLRATGTAQGRALRKSRQQLARNARAISAALDHLDVKSTASPSGIVRFTDVSDNWTYRCARALCQLTYETDQQFHQACLDMADQAIRGRVRASTAEENAAPVNVELAVPYLFAELPFFLNTPSLIGVESSMLVYHREWPIGDAIFAGDYPFSVAPDQGYLIVNPTESTNDTTEFNPTTDGIDK
ncbi:tRNA-dependent cyclodipeptide synthase [Rhodococcus fascians]|nr:tRNA-dependent cyclodipeptide synthase [Rhodococcus fascians]